MSDFFRFELEKNCGNARAGTFSTPHGIIETPVFMPVGTQATVKSLSPLVSLPKSFLTDYVGSLPQSRIQQLDIALMVALDIGY